jgi:hypothetical protein
MRAAISLRLRETRRRGGLWVLAICGTVILLVSLFGGATVDGSYGLATDLAATLSYVAAVFVGAFPLALDRENRRSYLPSASPVSPWQWALGNAAGAAIAVGVLAITLYAAAGIGAAARGGIDTYRVSSFGQDGAIPLRAGPRPTKIRVPEGTTHIRLSVRTYLVANDKLGTEEAAVVGVDGKAVTVHHNRPVIVEVRNNPVLLRNRSPAYAVAIDVGAFRALFERRSFLLNALQAGLPPALAAAGLAALGAAAGAHLGAAIAALLLAALLLLSSMRGFLLETVEYEGSLRRQQENSQSGEDHAGHGHDAPTVAADAPGRAFAKGAIAGLLDFVPAINELDRTGEVSTGFWVGRARLKDAAMLLAIALGCAALFGGMGLHLRRTP